MTTTTLTSGHLTGSVSTASPVCVVTMLYDRLGRSLDDAEFAISSAEPRIARTVLGHAKDIVIELSDNLHVNRWFGGQGLQSLYAWLIQQFVAIELSNDASLLDACREVIAPLRETWLEALQAQPVESDVRGPLDGVTSAQA